MTDFLIKDVCKICFNASSQKANPTLTLEEKAVNESGRKVCPNCRQNWTGQKVAKDTDMNKWVVVRPRPLKMNPHIDYQLCTSVLKKQVCPKGHGVCTFAHSQVELHSWNRERYKDPRPVPPGTIPNQIFLCKYITVEGNCPYGQRCVYAHSEDERNKWIDELAGLKGNGCSSATTEYYCPACGIYCTGQRQFEDHLSGQRHRQIVAAQIPPAVHHNLYTPPVHQLYSVAPRLNPAMSYVRHMPDRLPANGFRLCVSIATSRGCFYGARCTFAHSEAELDAWNKQALQYRDQRIPVGSIQSHMHSPSSHGDLDEFEIESPKIDQGDFAQRIRTTVMLDYQDKEQGRDLCGFEKTLQNVTISEVSGRGEALTLSDNAGNIHWVFEISATTLRTLQSVVLFDVLAPEYMIDNAELVMFGGHTKPIIPQAKTTNGSGIFLGQRITPPDKVNIKISFKPRSGMLGQMVIFDFGNFYMVRYLCVHVINEQDKRLLATNRQKRVNNRPDKPDYFWEQTYTTNIVEMDGLDVGETGLAEHQLPKVIEDLIEKGKYDNMQRKVVKKTYVRRMHNLLFLEEFQERKDLSRYDLYNIEVIPKEYYQTIGEIINDPRYSFVELDMMDEALFEGGRSIRSGDHVMMLLEPSTTGQSELHKCIVHSVMRDAVVMKMSKRTAEMCTLSDNKASVRFQPSRIRMRAMHEGLDRVDAIVIFPDNDQELEASTTSRQSLSPALNQCFHEIENSKLNGEQKHAIRSMLDPQYKKIPTLVVGPFGCGKTVTLCECVKLLSLHDPSAKILVCTHNNSAADIYVKAIHDEFAIKRNAGAPMLRLYYSERNPNTVDRAVLPYCKMRNDRFYQVDSVELVPYTIIVTTTMTARMLWLNGVEKGYFTHILIDEAAQVLETELLVALCLASKSTKIVLAGDAMQMDPPVHSTYAKKYGLDVSLLERLYNDELYNSGLGINCKIKLSENHRSHYDILHLPSKLFYENKLICKAVFPGDGPKHIPNLQFVGVDGHEGQEEQSPSYYNDQEIFKIAEEINHFCDGGQGLLPSQICVLSYYELQVKRIRNYLRQRRLSQVEVLRIDGIQGKEYRALIISTVRTCASLPDSDSENEDGFLNNVKFFNTAITRAKEWLVIVGEPITLCTVGYNTACWMELIENCIQKKTFRYQCADMFMKFLETRVISRQIMQKNHGEFLKKSTVPSQGSRIIAPPVSSESTDTRANATVTQPVVHPPLTIAQQQQQKIKETIAKSMQVPDDGLANTIYGEVLKLNPPYLNLFLVQPERASKYVRELENAMKRGGLTSVLMNNARLQPPNIHENSIQMQQQKSTQPPPNVMGDLPNFLRSQVDSLTQHLKYCDTQNCTSHASLRNLTEQKNLLLQQMNLVNQQILKYREFVKLNTVPTPQPQMQPSLQPSLQPNMMAPLIHSMNQLSTNPQIPQQHLPGSTNVGSNPQRMMFGVPQPVRNVPQPVRNVPQPVRNVPPVIQPTYNRHDNYSGNFQPLFHHQQQQQLPMNVSSVPPGITDAHHQPAQLYIKGGMTAASGGYNMGILSQQPQIHQHHSSAFNAAPLNPSKPTTASFQDPFQHSQSSFRQTTQLVSPLNNLAASQTWTGDDDMD